MKSNVWYLVYYKTIEILLGSLVIASYYILENVAAPLTAFLLLTLPTTYLFIFLIHRFQEKSRFLFFIVVFPLLIIGGLLLGFSIIFVLPLSMLIYWRTTILNSDGDSVKTGFWLFMTIFVGFILLILAKLNDYSYPNLLMIIMIFQIVVIIFGGFIINWFSILGNKFEKELLLRNFLSIFGMMAAISLLFVTFRDLIKWMVLSLLNMLAWTATFIMSPLFHWVEHYELTGEMNPFSRLQNIESGNMDTSFIPDHSQEVAQSSFDPIYLYITITIVLCILLFIFLYKKYQVSTGINDENDFSYFISSSYDEERGADAFKKRRMGGLPASRIRKEIYQLEKSAEKLQLGRISSETLGEWFKRVGVDEDELVQAVYEKVRYGNLFESDKEYSLFLNRIEKKKGKLKNIHKSLIKEGKIESNSRVKNLIKGFKSKK